MQKSESFAGARVLVVEDEEKVVKALHHGLEQAGYVVSAETSGDAGLKAVLERTFDIIVLDVMLPGAGGLVILQALRARPLATPVLLLTARDSLADRVRGLDAGADDYLVKPFALPELLARLRALSRRHHRDSDRLTFADLTLDRLTRYATRGSQPLLLTPKEFDLLAYLLRHSGQVVSREMLARDVWREESRGTALDNVIDVHLVRLRRKVDHGFTPRLIRTVRGLGIVLRDCDD